MRFSNGVYAQVTLKKEIIEKDNGEILTSTSHCFYDSRSVYDLLIDYFDHNTAAEAESWTELACVGEWYEADGFEIEMMED